jgi:hypothetical protein
MRIVEEEGFMESSAKKRLRTIIDLEKVNTLNEEGCPACGGKFALGEPVVLACGAWEGEPKYIHENEAIFDDATETYSERRYYESRKS